jgi:CelD/BcsL family acetyltransferase involved in cellulose biosynthesis
MDIAVSDRPAREQTTPAATRRADKVARVETFHDMPAAELFWRRLEGANSLSTPYQRFDLLAAWQHHVGERTGVTPFIIVGLDQAGEPLCLWPFGRIRKGPLHLVSFLGSKHANFNIALWRRESLAAIGAGDIGDILARVADHGVDLVALFDQPFAWDGLANPFALLPHQASVDASAHLRARPGISESHCFGFCCRARFLRELGDYIVLM